MKKMLMLATTAAMIEQFNKNNILILEEMGYEVHVAGNWQEGNPISQERLMEFRSWLDEHHGRWFHIPSTRRPMDIKNNGKALKQVVNLIEEFHYEFIHCHTPIGSIIGRLAACWTHTKIIYTAHGFHFFKGAPLKNWLLYYPAEWVCSWMTDILITINQEDYSRAKKHLHAKCVKYIPGVGVDVAKFAACFVDKKEKCRELGVPDDKFILLSVGELQERKNQKVVLDALHKLHNPDIYYLIVGQGILKEEYEKKIKQYGLENNVKLLGFRNDIDELCEIADCFVFPSLQEGLPVALMEAMASGLPVICSETRGNTDLIKDGDGGYCVDAESAEEMAEAIRAMLNDMGFRRAAGAVNFEAVKKYDICNCEKVMQKIYSENMFGGGYSHLIKLLQRKQKREETGFFREDFLIISVGELNQNKNHEVIIKALGEIVDEHVKYVICGQGVLREYLEHLIAEMHLESRVWLAGYRKDIDELLMISDVFAFPSKREGLGLAAIEAMAAGLPLISSYVGGIRDYAVEGVTGCCIEPDSVEQAVYAIRKIYADKAFRNRCGCQNRIKAQAYDCRLTDAVMKEIYLG